MNFELVEFKTTLNTEVLNKEVLITSQDEYTYFGDVMKLCKNKIKEIEEERKAREEPKEEKAEETVTEEKPAERKTEKPEAFIPDALEAKIQAGDLSAVLNWLQTAAPQRIHRVIVSAIKGLKIKTGIRYVESLPNNDIAQYDQIGRAHV